MKHATTLLFVVGFVLDMVLLPDIANRLTQYIGLAYLLIIGVLIVLREYIVEQNRATHTERILYSSITFGIAYFSGSALSFVFVYAVRGAALSVSWPLFIILLLCSVVNELVASHKFRFTLDIGVFFIALLFYIVFNAPVVLNVQNDLVFLVSLSVAAVLSFLYISFLRSVSEVAEHEAPRGYALAVGVPLFVGMLYMLNVIPAVPLTLASAGVYHNVTRLSDGSYLGKEEVLPKQNVLLAKMRDVFIADTYHLAETDSGAYFFSAIVSPANLTAPVSHVWEYYDVETHKWVHSFSVSFDSVGGRAKGYRSYSQKESIREGRWRVTVKVASKRIVGRYVFTVKKSLTPVTTKSVGL